LGKRKNSGRVLAGSSVIVAGISKHQRRQTRNIVAKTGGVFATIIPGALVQ
jgi:hypothetical protein